MELKLAIQAKLQSQLDVKDKCIFARNVFFAGKNVVSSSEKEEIIIGWVVTTLLKKFSDNSTDDCDIAEVSRLLVDLVRSPKFETSFIVATQDKLWDLLNCIVDHSSHCSDEGSFEKWFAILVRNNRLVRVEMTKKMDALNHFTAKCLQSSFAPQDIVWLYQQALQQTNNIVNVPSFQDTVLHHLLAFGQTDINVCKIVVRAVFSKTKAAQWNSYLLSLIEEKEADIKPKSFDFLEVLLTKLTMMSCEDQQKCLTTLFQSALQCSDLTERSKSLLFCLLCYILQLYPPSDNVIKLSPLVSVKLIAIKTDSKKRIGCLGSLVKLLIDANLDMNTQLVETAENGSSLMNFVQHLFKNLLDNQPDHLEDICSIAIRLAKANPLVTEPLIGTLTVSVMSIDDTELMCELINLYQRLRQLPKFVARLLITLSKGKQGSLSDIVLQCFAENVSKLPIGQILDLWKTFEYQLSNATLGSSHQKALDDLMSIFVIHACQVEQSIPETSMEKITASLKAATEKGQGFPKLQTSLNELTLSLHHSRGMKIENMETMSNLQKRKLESLDGQPIKKVRLSWQDVNAFPVQSWNILLQELSDEELEIAINDVISRPIKVDLFEESERLQKALISLVLKRQIKHCKEKKVVRFLTLLESGKVDEAANAFVESSKLDTQSLTALEVLPLEHLSGPLEASLTLLFLSAAKNEASVQHLLTRALFAGFRTCSVLKYKNVVEVLDIVSGYSSCSDLTYFRDCIKSLCKAGVTYQKTLDDIVDNLSVYCLALEELNNESKVLISTCFLECIEPVLTGKVNIGDEKKAKSEALFKGLSKGLLSGLKLSKISIDISILHRALTAIVQIICHQNEKKSLKKWASHLDRFVDVKGTCSLDFFIAILENFDKLGERMNGEFLQTLVTKDRLHRKPVSSDSEKALLKLLFEVVSAQDVSLFNTMLSDLEMKEDFAILTNWIILVTAKLSNEESIQQRRDFFNKSILRSASLLPSDLNEDTLSKAHWPQLDLYRVLLECDKPILNKESEALCVGQSIALLSHDDILSPMCFERTWKAVFEVMSNAFHRRPRTLVVTRIPLIAAGMRNLLCTLCAVSDQKNNWEPSKIKGLVNLSYDFDRLCDHIKKLKDEFARISPYLVADVMESFQKWTLYPSIRSNILHGVHKLLDICDSHSIDYLTSVLSSGQQEMFKHLFSNYKQYYKYGGRV